MAIFQDITHFFERMRSVKRLEKQFAKTDVKPLQIDKKPIQFKSSSQPKVSIIIPFYNEEAYTWNCLQYLHKNLSDKIAFEILLIDDNSPETCDFSQIDGISVIRNGQNLGFLRNINKGIDLAKGEFIYILNNDTEVQPGFLDELFFVFDHFDNVGAVGSKLLNADRSIQEAGAVFLKNCEIRQIGYKKEPFYPEINYICKTDYGSGCSLLFRKYADDGQMNLLDEQYIPAYFEETDFCFSLKFVQHKNVYYTPFSEVLHFNGVTYNSQKTEVSKLQKKEVLFKANLEKFQSKWKKQLDAINGDSIEQRIQEIYGKSVVIFADGLSSDRLKSVVKTFTELGFHVTLISKYTLADDPQIEYYQRIGVNIFYGHKSYVGYQKFVRKQKSRALIVWFFGKGTFKNHGSVAKKHMASARLFYDMSDTDAIKIGRAEAFSEARLKNQINEFLSKNEQ